MMRWLCLNPFPNKNNIAACSEVVITETGWPSFGEGLEGAKPSHENAIKYIINLQVWSDEADIEMFYFSSFDK